MPAKRKPKKKQVGKGLLGLLSGLLGGRKRIVKRRAVRKPQRGGKLIGLSSGFSNMPPPLIGTW